MNLWSTWKKGFDIWERTTASYLEEVIQNPLVMNTSGHALTAFMKAKAASDSSMAKWWGSVGLPTKRDQERTLHALNQMQSRLMDLEERLEEMDRN